MAKGKKPKAELSEKMAKLEKLLQNLDAEPEEAVVTSPPKKLPPDNAKFREPKTRTHPHRLECGHWNWWLSGTKKDKNRICTDPACKKQRWLEKQEKEEKK